MARDITAGFQTEIEASTLRPALLLKGEFKTGDVLAWSGVGELNYNTETYAGLGDFLGVSAVEETQQLAANGIQLSLNGIKSSLVSLALDPTEYHWRPLTIWFAVLDSDYALIADPYKIFSGKMDIVEINDDGQTSSILMNVENNLIDLKESRERRYTPEDQKRYFAGDLGLDFVPTIQDITITWGSS